MVKTNILILSATASAHNLINALRDRQDFQLFVCDCNRYAYGLYYKKIKSFLIPRARDFKKYVSTLKNIVKENNIHVIIPSSDHDMEAFSKILALEIDLGEGVNYFKFNPVIFKLMNDKKELANALSSLDFIKFPKTYTEKNVDYPCIIKPTNEGGSKDIYKVFDANTFQNHLINIKKKYKNDFLIQEYIPGKIGSMHVVLLLFDEKGNLINSMITKSSRTMFSWGGGGLAGKLVENNELIKKSLKMINYLGGWKGPINIEFMEYENEFFLIEINCRLNGYSYFTTLCGNNFPKQIVEILSKKNEISKPSLNKNKNFDTYIKERIIYKWK